MKTRFFVILLFILSIVPLLDLFYPGIPVTHDGQDHVARIANFYKNLEEGNIIPRWAANLNWGYGHPILMFLYPLPSYAASLFHFLGFSLVDSTKIVFGTTYILSGLTMYFWINEFLGKRAAFISSLLYLLVPYRFVDLYVRGAIGEHVAFVFPPLILYFLLKLSKKPSQWSIIGGPLSLAGLILSHNAISIMFLPLISLYALYLFWLSKEKKRLIYQYTSILVFGLGLSAFFWFPAFFEGKYTLRDIVTAGEFSSRFVRFQSLLWGEWNYGGSGQFTTQVGPVQWLMVLLSAPSIILLRRKKNNLWILTAGSFILFIGTLFLMTSGSKFVWETVTTLQKFQFPWRFLSVTVFATALLGGLFVAQLPKKKQFFTCFLLLIALLWFNKDYWHAKSFLVKLESFYTGIYQSTTDTGESSPIWSVRFMEKEPKARIEVIDGNASIKELKRSTKQHEYEIEARGKARIRENTLYFPGWEVFIDGKIVSIEFQDPANRGLMTFYVDEGKHLVQVRFGETRLRQFADYISLGSLIIMFLIPFLWKILQKITP